MHTAWIVLAWVAGGYVVAGVVCVGWYLFVPQPEGQAMPTAGCWLVFVFPVHVLVFIAALQAYDWVRNWWYGTPPQD